MPIDRVAAAKAIDAFLLALGRDPARETDLAGTGERVAAAYADELCAGYAIDTKKLLAENVIATKSQGVVVVRDIPVATMCPHHLLPALGAATVAFQPSRRIVGLGAVASLVDAHARRLTLQETIGWAVVDDLFDAIAPVSVACRLELRHGCMIARGEKAHGTSVTTLAHRGEAQLLGIEP